MIDRTQRIPPYSEEAERGLLGASLLPSEDGTSRILWLCAERGLDPDAFYLRGHQVLFQSMLEMSAKGIHTDILTLTNYCRKAGTLDLIGGVFYLDELMVGCPTSAHAEYYADIVAEQYQLRRLIDAARMAIDIAYDEDGATAGERIAEAQSRMLALEAQRGQRTHAQVLKDIDRRMVEAHERKSGGLPCPWKTLTDLWGGPLPGLTTAILARKRTGKSTLVGQWIDYLDNEFDMPVLMAPFEDGPEKFFLRMAALRHQFSAFAALHGRLGSDFQLSRARQHVADLMGNSSIHFVDGRCSLPELIAYSVQAKAKYGIEAVFVDAFKDIKVKRQDLETDGILSQGLAELADRLQVPVIYTAHVVKIDDNDLIQLRDLRGSSRITDDTKLIMAIQRSRGEYGFDVLANNHGPEGIVPVKFETNPERFVEDVAEAEQPVEQGGLPI